MSIKMLSFVDDLGRFPRIWGCGNYQAIILTKYSYDFCRHICKSFFKFVYLMSAKIVKRLILRDMFPLCLEQNVSNKLFTNC